MKKILLTLICLSCFLVCNLSAQLRVADNTNFYDTKNVKEIRITFDQKNWPDILDSLRLYGDGLLAGMIAVDGKSYKNVGIRYRGSRSFQTGSKRNALHIKLNYIEKDQNHKGYKTLKLSNALRDPSMIREVLGYEIARKYMHAPQANHAKLYINGEYYGLFINVESVDNVFLNKHFGSSDNSKFKCSPDLDAPYVNECKKNIYANLEYEKNASCYARNYEIKSDDGWDDLIALTKTLNNDTKNIEKILNVDQALWMLAFNNVLVNLSSYSGQYSQNYYLYKDNDGRFTPIIWDLNLAFGSFKNTGSGSDLNLQALQQLDPLLHIDNPAKPLISKLLAIDEYKKVYLSHIRTILYENFIGGQYEKRARDLQRLITVPHFNDQNKQYDHNKFLASLNNTTGKRSKIPGIIELMSKRTKFLKKHKSVSFIPPSIDDVKVLNRKKFDKANSDTYRIQAKVGKHAKRVTLYYRYAKSEKYQTVVMLDDGKNNDEKANDNIYGISVDAKNKEVEYYIVAENVASINYSPSNYMFEPYSSMMKELNK